MPEFGNFEPRLRSVMPFEAAPAELRLLRKRIRCALGQWGALAVAEEAELAVTELATNVIKHVGEGAAATLVLEWRDGTGSVWNSTTRATQCPRAAPQVVMLSAAEGCTCWQP
jgi:hypothetical protein